MGPFGAGLAVDMLAALVKSHRVCLCIGGIWEGFAYRMPLEAFCTEMTELGVGWSTFQVGG